MASEDVTITGLAELQAQLDQLAPLVERKLMRGALRAGQKTVLEQARQGVHSISGELAASLRISTRARHGRVSATVVAGDGKAFYAKFVEFGTAAHLIKAANGSALSFGGGAYAVLQHPGAMKRPFMRPALDAAAQDGSPAFQAVAAYLQPRINRQLASLPDESDGVTR